MKVFRPVFETAQIIRSSFGTKTCYSVEAYARDADKLRVPPSASGDARRP